MVPGTGPQNQVRTVWWAATGRSVRVQTRWKASSAKARAGAATGAAAGAGAGAAGGWARAAEPGRLAARASPAMSHRDGRLLKLLPPCSRFGLRAPGDFGYSRQPIIASTPDLVHVLL